MATEIFHGAPGSYKSSTVMWFRLLEALKQGRIVVSNLQGLKTIEAIQSELNIVFPDTARIYRISIGSEVGIRLIRNFYHWLPIGAFIFIDEIQDVYPNDSSFKAKEYDYIKEGEFDEILPVELVEAYHAEQRKIKHNVDVDEYLDDVGESLFDEREYLRYPRTLRECFMRHRHYNWDICLASPDIKEIASFVRSVSEVAFAHSSKDSIPISYYKRRPRVLQHSPKENGLTVKKSDIITARKIPLEVFKLYKSTATGQTTKSGMGGSPIGLAVQLGAVLVFAYFVFVFYYFFSSDDNSEPVQVDQVSYLQDTVREENRALTKETDKQVSSSSFENPKSGNDNVIRDVSLSNIIADSNFVNLPFKATEMYISGLVTEYETKYRVNRTFVFNLTVDDSSFSINSDELLNMGYKIFYKHDCLIELRNSQFSHFLYCQPRLLKQVANDSVEQQPLLSF